MNVMNRRYRMIFVLLLTVIIRVPVSGQKTIPFVQGISQKKEVKLSEVATDVKYIPLETTSDCLLGQDILDIKFAGGYLFVSDFKNLFQFTPAGKFIRKIGKTGQGPGEYTESILGVTYDEAKKEIFLSDPRQQKLHVYSFEGKFLRDIKLGDWSYVQLRDPAGRFYGLSNMYLDAKDKKGKELTVYDERGKALYDFRFRPVAGMKYPGILFSLSVLYLYKDAVYSLNPLETTIYRLDGKKRISAYELDLSDLKKLIGEEEGNLVVDKKRGVGSLLPSKAAEKKIIFNNIFETDRHMGIFYVQNGLCFAWYDKETGKACRVRSSNTDRDGFTDNLEGGYPLLPAYFRDGKIMSVIPATLLLEKVKSAHAKGSLKKVLDKLQEDDNQVICVATLK